jgi:D-lactate dehydrogenase
MKVSFFSSKSYDRKSFETENEKYGHALIHYEPHLDRKTAPLAKGTPAVCVFVNDELDDRTLEILSEGGTSIIALRCAGFNNVDLVAARKLGFSVVRVPAYSPYAVAEHAVALMLTLNRKTHRAYNRIREGNFSLDGLLGFDLYGKTTGVIGTGRIGAVFCRIISGFGCRILAYDHYQNDECVGSGVEYADLDDLFKKSDIISLHCPLTPSTYHIVGQKAISLMKNNVMLINTSRGALVDAQALIDGLKSGKVGFVGLDVYEEEADLFFEDLSDQVIQDDVFARLTTFPNVVITGHQAFFTSNALQNIASTTLSNLTVLEKGEVCPNLVP